MSPCLRRYIFPEPGRTLLVCLHESSTEFRYRFVCVRQASAVRTARPKPEESACSYFDQLPELKNYERSFFFASFVCEKALQLPQPHTSSICDPIDTFYLTATNAGGTQQLYSKLGCRMSRAICRRSSCYHDVCRPPKNTRNTACPATHLLITTVSC